MKRSTRPKSTAINISEFKAKALALIQDTATLGCEYIITKKGVPVAQVVPILKGPKCRYGSLKGLVETRGDIVSFDTSEDWDVLR